MILLQAHTREQIDSLVNKPTHGVLLSGPEGSGKAYTAHVIASRLLDTSLEKLDTHPYFRAIQPEKGSVGIDQIRELQKLLHLKVPGKGGIRRVIVLERAELMTTEAQNALLKSLEEPPADTVIILTAPASRNIKETIYSRVRQIQVLPVDKDEAVRYFSQRYDQVVVERAYMLSAGHIGLMHALLEDEEHALAHAIKQAKELLSLSRYERLARVEELSKQKEALPMLLQACKLICTTALRQAAEKQADKQTKRWHATLSTVHATEATLLYNPNTKLLLTDLMLQL